MAGLKVIENELVPVYETSTGEKVVYGSELYECLGSKRQYTDWIKTRLKECDAIENEDYQSFSQNNEKPMGGRPKLEYLIKLDTAKEMAMLERNDKGKQVRKYFIQVEEKYKNNVINRSQLSPQMQMLMGMVETQARQEIEQKRLAEEQERIKEQANKQGEAIKTVVETFKSTETDEGTEKWINKCISKIAESPNFSYSFGNKYSAARTESYRRLTDRAGCRLDVKLRNAVDRATERGYTKAQINQITKLSVIMVDKRLKQIYISVIKEMMVAYCVEVE